jgi:predicted signal transduction protein with EAL and GGDEF domain
VFNTDHALDIKKLNQIDQLLRNADLDREMTVVYQPIVNLESGRTVSAEALARWHSPVLGNVSPAQFIKAAERSDLINRLTVLLYRKALADMKSWPKSVGLSFNLSARDVASQDTILHLAAITLKSGIDPRRIEFEVTETAVMADFDQALSALTRLRSIGLRIGLDDFGTGYSSLGYVHRLPLDKVKIDIQFISDIADNRTARSIVKSVIDLARNLGFASLAEGVETEEQARIIHAMGCGRRQSEHQPRLSRFLRPPPARRGDQAGASPWPATRLPGVASPPPACPSRVPRRCHRDRADRGLPTRRDRPPPPAPRHGQ